MKREWQPEELIECWTLLDRDQRLVANKTELLRVRRWWRTVRRRQNLRPSEGLSICATVTLSIGTLRIAERTASTGTLPGGRPSPGQPCCRPPPSSKVRRRAREARHPRQALAPLPRRHRHHPHHPRRAHHRSQPTHLPPRPDPSRPRRHPNPNSLAQRPRATVPLLTPMKPQHDYLTEDRG
jgi:hypothetical protein